MPGIEYTMNFVVIGFCRKRMTTPQPTAAATAKIATATKPLRSFRFALPESRRTCVRRDDER